MQQDIVIFIVATAVIIGALLAVSLPALLRKKKSDSMGQDSNNKKKAGA